MPLLDLAEVEDVIGLDPTWSARRSAPVRFRRADFLGDRAAPLAGRCATWSANGPATAPRGPVAILANLRTWGWLFNPISLYFCADLAGLPATRVVTVTPGCRSGEHPMARAPRLRGGHPGTHHFPKALHVSPFLPMGLDYQTLLRAPGNRLVVGFDVLEGDQSLFGPPCPCVPAARPRRPRAYVVELPGGAPPDHGWRLSYAAGLRRYEGRSVLRPPGAPGPGPGIAAGSCPHCQLMTRWPTNSNDGAALGQDDREQHCHRQLGAGRYVGERYRHRPPTRRHCRNSLRFPDPARREDPAPATTSGWRRADGLSRRIVLAAGRRASGAAIEVTEAPDVFVGSGWPVARVRYTTVAPTVPCCDRARWASGLIRGRLVGRR